MRKRITWFSSVVYTPFKTFGGQKEQKTKEESEIHSCNLYFTSKISWTAALWPSGWRTGFQVELAEVLRGAESDHHHTVPEDVLPAGHLESELCAGDETVLLDHRVDGLHPAVSEVHPGWAKGRRGKGAAGWEVQMSGGAGGGKKNHVRLNFFCACICWERFNSGCSRNTEFQHKSDEQESNVDVAGWNWCFLPQPIICILLLLTHTHTNWLYAHLADLLHLSGLFHRQKLRR